MPEKPTPSPASKLPEGALVNENELSPGITIEERLGEFQRENKRLVNEIESYKSAQIKYREKLQIAEAKVARNHSSPEAMRFRIFLEIVNGMAAGNKFDPQTSAGKESRLFQHASGLAEVAYAEIEKRELFGLK